MTFNNLDFLGRDCKQNKHHECVDRWHGLGLQIYCHCDCHKKDDTAPARDDVKTSEIWDSQLVKGIRRRHDNTTNIAEYEEEMLSHQSHTDTRDDL